MKKLLLVALLVISTSASANGNRYNHNSNQRWNNGAQSGWIGPAVIGGVIGYMVARPFYQPQPVYVQPPVYFQPQQCYIQTVYDQYGRPMNVTVCN